MSEIHIDSPLGTPVELKLETLAMSPHLHRTDPHASLPSNSELLSHHIATILTDLETHLEEEKWETQKLQRQVAVWEERIRSNYFQMGKNVDQIKSNLTDVENEIMHRDYWWNREHLVLSEFSIAKSSKKASDWSWLIKKYGLKNVDGSSLDPFASCIEELCHGAIHNLAIEYREAGVRYDLTQSYKKAQSDHLSSINAKLSATNVHLRNYINNVHTAGIETVQDGMLFLKEFALKLKALQTQETPATFGEMRAWAEEHLDQFLKKYPSIPHRVVSSFRRLASIPLPAQNS